MNRVIAIDLSTINIDDLKKTLAELRFLMSDFLIFYKYDEDGNVKNVIGISKRFNVVPNKNLKKYKIIKDHLGYFPQFHTLERLCGDTIDDYTITQYDAVCVVPEIHKYGNTYERFRYGNLIDDVEWQFINKSDNIVIDYPESSVLPHLSSNDGQITSDGFYDVVFRYKLGGEQKELRLDSAFRKKSI